MKDELQEILKLYSRRVFAVQALIFLGILCISLGSSYLVKKHLAVQVTQMVEGQVKNGEYKEALFMLSSAKQQSFVAIGYFDRDGNRIFTLPANLKPTFFSDRSLFDQLIHATVSVDVLNEPAGRPFGKIIYVFDGLSILPIGILFWVFATLISKPFLARHKKLVIESFEKQAVAKRSEISAEIAAQVKHDVNSPMQALCALAEVSTGLTDFERTCLSDATNRIEQIVADLSKIGSTNLNIDPNIKANHRPVSVIMPLYEVFREKVLQTMPKSQIKFDLNICDNPQAIFSKIDESVFKRVISNIIANAIEAISGEGFISISIDSLGDQRVQIKIADTGRGIPAERIEKLGQKGVSFKLKGTGIGLHHAKSKIQEWGGDLKIDSVLGRGTAVTVTLPRELVPSWRFPKIEFLEFAQLPT